MPTYPPRVSIIVTDTVLVELDPTATHERTRT